MLGRGLSWWLLGLRGIAATAFGILLLASPQQTLFLFVQLFSIYLVFDGILHLMLASRMRRSYARNFHRFLGFTSLIVGGLVLVLMLLNIALPDWLLTIVGIAFGVLAILEGVRALNSSRRIRGRLRSTFTLLTGGIALALGVITLFVVLGSDRSLSGLVGVGATGLGVTYLGRSVLALRGPKEAEAEEEA